MNEHAKSPDMTMNTGDCLCGKAPSESHLLFQDLFENTWTSQEEMVAYVRRIQSEIVDNEVALSNFWLDSWKQSGSMLVSWMDIQRQLGDTWRQALIEQAAPHRDPAGGSAENVLATWHEAASQAVSIQNQRLGLCLSIMGQGPRPSETSPSGDEASGSAPHTATPSAVSVRRKPARVEEIA
jgi:hypothetical protein